jgi:DNA-binding XRE family transcriptional regulator
LRAESDRPESRPPSVDVFVSYEPLDGALAARVVGWRDFDQGQIDRLMLSVAMPGRQDRAASSGGELCARIGDDRAVDDMFNRLIQRYRDGNLDSNRTGRTHGQMQYATSSGLDPLVESDKYATITLRDRVARRIKRLRKHRGMTQGTLARAADITREHLVRIEQARYAPSVDLLERLAKALRVDPGRLVMVTKRK